MSNMTVKGTKKLTSANSPANAVLFLIEQSVSDMLNTAEVVSIKKAEASGTGAAGYASATPLVCSIDGYHNTIPPSTIAKLPFFRPQAGKAAIIMDPQPGDKAVAVYMKRDSSNVQSGGNDPVPPASFRRFDQADGYLLNGFLGEAPEIWLMLDPVTGNIELSTKAANIEISCRESGDVEIKAVSGSINLTAGAGITQTAPSITLNGNVAINGNLTLNGSASGANGAALQIDGNLESEKGSIIAKGVALEKHTHGGVESGGKNTGAPNPSA